MFVCELKTLKYSNEDNLISLPKHFWQQNLKGHFFNVTKITHAQVKYDLALVIAIFS